MWSEHEGACTTVCGWASELIDVLYCNIVHVCIDRTSSSSCVHNILCNHDRTPTLSFHLGVFFFQTVAAILSERMMMFTLPLSSVVLRSNGGGGTGSFHAIIPRLTYLLYQYTGQESTTSSGIHRLDCRDNAWVQTQ